MQKLGAPVIQVVFGFSTVGTLYQAPKGTINESNSKTELGSYTPLEKGGSKAVLLMT